MEAIAGKSPALEALPADRVLGGAGLLPHWKTAVIGSKTPPAISRLP